MYLDLVVEMFPNRSRIRRHYRCSFNVDISSSTGDENNNESLPSENFNTSSEVHYEEAFPCSSPPPLSSPKVRYQDSPSFAMFDDFPSSPIGESIDKSFAIQGISPFDIHM